MLETILNDEKFLLINLYKANTEKEQLNVLDLLASKLDDHNVEGDCKTILGGDLFIL